MIHRLEYLKDTVGNNYIGVNIYVDMVQPYLERLRGIIGDECGVYINNQQNRDHGHYHITVINVMDYNKLSKDLGMDKFVNSLESAFDFDFDDVKFIGIGTAEKGGNRTYFIVVKSDKLQEVRKKYGLPEQDFHVTIGFKWKDVFGVRKNEVLKESEPFCKLLRDLYYKSHETFEFVKEVENFSGDPELDIEPIEIRDTTATFRNGENDYFSISLLDNGLRVVAQWQDTEKRPILSNTLISKKFKDI
jgi:hypothetical protein